MINVLRMRYFKRGIKVTRIGELVTANVVPSSSILVTLMVEALIPQKLRLL
jgi:hypothetical protein